MSRVKRNPYIFRGRYSLTLKTEINSTNTRIILSKALKTSVWQDWYQNQEFLCLIQGILHSAGKTMVADPETLDFYMRKKRDLKKWDQWRVGSMEKQKTTSRKFEQTWLQNIQFCPPLPLPCGIPWIRLVKLTTKNYGFLELPPAVGWLQAQLLQTIDLDLVVGAQKFLPDSYIG